MTDIIGGTWECILKCDVEDMGVHSKIRKIWTICGPQQFLERTPIWSLLVLIMHFQVVPLYMIHIPKVIEFVPLKILNSMKAFR